MTANGGWNAARAAGVLGGVVALAMLGGHLFPVAEAAEEDAAALRESFEQHGGPFLERNCVLCHNESNAMSGVTLDQLDGAFKDRHLRLWEVVQAKISDGTMPPDGHPSRARTSEAG